MSLSNNLRSKDSIIDGLLKKGRLYHNQKFYLVESHTSAAIVALQDWLKTSTDHLNEKISFAINWDGSLWDYKILKALNCFASDQSIYLTLALYLYLADEVSRNPNPEGFSFFTAAHMCKFELEMNETVTPEKKAQLKNALIESLKLLGIYNDEKRELVKNWCNGGEAFYVGGEVQARVKLAKNNYFSFGAYSELAYKILSRGKSLYFQISDCVSFARGHLDKMREYKDSPEDAYEHIKILVKDESLIDSTITIGDGQRHLRMRSKVIDFFNKLADKFKSQGQETPTLYMQEEEKAFYKNLLGGLSVDALNILEIEGYSIAYSSSQSIRDIYPDGYEDGSMPGLAKDRCETTRGSAAARLSKYKILFISKGDRAEQLTPEQLLNCQQQTLAHEISHMVLGAGVVDKAEIIQLKNDAYNILYSFADSEKLDLAIPLITRKNRLLSDVLDPKSYIYNDYNANKHPSYTEKVWEEETALLRGEEIICDIYGLINSEFSREKKPENNPFYSSTGQPENALHKLVQDIENISRETSFNLQAKAKKTADQVKSPSQ